MVVAKPGSYTEALQKLTQERQFKPPLPPEKPEPIDLPAMGIWTPEKVTGLYNTAHQQGAFYTPEQIQTIDLAHNYIQQTGGAALPTEVQDLLSALPTAPDATTPQLPEMGYAVPVPSVQEQAPYSYYGLTKEQWDSLSLGKQLAMRTMSTSVGAAATTGAVAGLQGGIPGVIGGAVFGASLGALAERYPIVAKIGDAFDVLVENLVMRPIGFAALNVAALRGDGIDLEDIYNDLESAHNAWLAGEQVFRVNAGYLGPRPENYVPEPWSYDWRRWQYMGGRSREPTGVPFKVEVWEGPQNPLATHTLTEEQVSTNALIEYFNRLEAGEAPAQIDRDFEQRFGFGGQMTDLGARIFLDPLNIIGGLTAKAIGVSGKLLGASDDFYKAYNLDSSPVKAAKEFKLLKSGLSPEEAKALPWIERWASPYTKTGEPKLTAIPETPTNPIARAYGYITGLTPEARAREYVSTGSMNIAALAERSNMSMPDLVKNLKMVADNQPSAAAALSMNTLKGPEWSAVVPAIRDTLPKLQNIVDDFYAPARQQARRAIETIAKLSGDDVGKLVKKLADPTNGERTAKTTLARLADIARRSGDDAAQEILRSIDAGELTADSLREMGESFTSGMALNEQHLRGQVYAELMDSMQDWSVQHFKVKADTFPVRLSNMVKSLQGAVLLDLNFAYGAQNVVDNFFKLSRDVGLFSYLAAGHPEKFMNDFIGEGFLPERLRQGLVSDTGVPHLRGGDAITAAKRSGDLIGKVEEASGALRSKNPLSMSKLSGNAEQKMRLRGFVAGTKQAWNRLWKRGTGFDRLPPAVEEAIRAQGGNPENLYRIVESDHNFGRILNEVIGGKAEYRPRHAVDIVAKEMGMRPADLQDMFDKLGISDYLEENLPKNFTRDDLSRAMANVEDIARKKFNEMSKDQKLVEVEKAANKIQTEGPLGFFEAFDDIGIERGEQRLYDWADWDHLWSMKDQLTPQEFGNRVQLQYSYQRDIYRRLNENTRALYLGAIEKLGADSSYAKALADSMVADEGLWSGFYKTVQKEYRDFFRKAQDAKNKGGGWNEQSFAELRDRLARLYEDTNTKSLELQQARDLDLENLIGTRYGEPARAAAEEWLKGVRDLDAEMYQAMTDFRERVSRLPADERGKAWNDFLTREHKPRIVERMRLNREGANEVYMRAAEAERLGQVNEQTISPPKPIDSERRRPAASGMRNELNRLNKVIEQLKAENEGLKTDPATGLKLGIHYADEINSAPVKMAVDIMGLGYLNDAYSHAAGDILLKNFAETISEIGHKGYRNKTGGDEFTLVFNSMDEAIEAEARLHEIMMRKEIPVVDKATGKPMILTGFDIRAGIGETLQAADEAERAIKATMNVPKGTRPPGVTETLVQTIQDAVDTWAKDVGKKPEVAKVDVDPDPVGVAPPGTVDAIYDKPYYRLFSQGWRESVEPALRQLELALADGKNAPAVSGLDAATTAAIRQWLEQVQGQMSDTKLMAMKWAESYTDTAMLNYNKRRGFDDIANMFAPYQFWYGRTIMNWAISAIDRPAWFANWWRIREAQEKFQRPIPGLPARLAGKLQIPLPFLPDGWGDTIYLDPYHQVFGFDAMAGQVMRPLMRDFSNLRSRAEYILQEMADNGEISPADMQAAIAAQQGQLWEQVYNQAKSEYDAEIASPVDLVSTMFSPSLPLSWAMERLNLKQKRVGGTLPAFSTIQNITSPFVPGGVHIPSVVQGLITGKPTEPDARGDLFNYYVLRELSNMAIMGADPAEVELAMVERSGPLWDQAMSTVGNQQLVRSFGSILWSDFFPEGEQQQRALKYEFIKAADNGTLPEFFDAHPEYQARMMLRNANDPDAMMDQFLRSAVWDAYNKLTPLERKEYTDQLGELFQTAFLSKETRSYDSIDTETLVQWARALSGVVPGNAPDTAQLSLEKPEPAANAAYSAFKEWQKQQPGYALYNMMWDLPEGMRDQFKLNHPEVVLYQEQKDIYYAEHPEILPYVIGEENYLYGAPPEVQFEVYQYRAEKARLFPMISVTQAMYYNLASKADRSAYLRQHPELKAYWDWSRERKDELSAPAYYYVVGESGIEKLREGDRYQEEYRIDYNSFSPELSFAIAMNTMAGRGLSDGARQELYRLWNADGKPFGSFDEYLQRVLDAFSYSQ